MYDFQQLLKSIFILFYSEFQNVITHKHFEHIKLQIEDLNVETLYNNEKITKTENELNKILDLEKVMKIDYDKCKCIKDFIENVFIEASQSISQSDKTCEKNAYYNPQFCEELMKLCMEFVLWSHVMQQNCSIKDDLSDFGTLAESYRIKFDEYLAPKFESTPRLNEYLLKCIDFEYEKLEKYRKCVDVNATKKIEKKNLEYSYMQHEENWMGLNNYRVKANKDIDSKSLLSSDSDSSSDVEFMLEDDNYDSDDIDFKEENFSISRFIDSICKDESTNTSQSHAVTSEVLSLSTNENKEISILPMHVNDYADSTEQDNMSKFKNNTSENQNFEIQKSKPEKCSSVTKATVRRGKFLRPCEDMYLLQQKPTQSTTTKRKVIKNSNQSTSTKINKERRILATSSHFDSVVEILTSAYCNIHKFQNFITETANSSMQETSQAFLNILQKYVENFSSRELSTSRIKFVEKLCSSLDTKFCWTDSIGEFYNKIMPSSIIEKFECNQCSFIIYRHANIIKMSTTEIMSKNYFENIIKHLHVPDTCDKCGHNIFVADISIKNIIAIDIEDTKNKCESVLKLNELMSHILIEEQTFILIGVVGFEDPIGDQTTRHYYACCRSFQGFWMKYDDTEESTKPIRISEKATTISGAILIYIEYDNKE